MTGPREARPPLPGPMLTAIAEHARRDYPHEACGLVLADPQGQLLLQPSPNLAVADTPPGLRCARFIIDPMLLLRAARLGLTPRIIYHSHCDADDRLSARDQREALGDDGLPLWPGGDLLVVSVARGRPVSATRYGFDTGAGRFAPVDTFGPEALATT